MSCIKVNVWSCNLINIILTKPKVFGKCAIWIYQFYMRVQHPLGLTFSGTRSNEDYQAVKCVMPISECFGKRAKFCLKPSHNAWIVTFFTSSPTFFVYGDNILYDFILNWSRLSVLDDNSTISWGLACLYQEILCCVDIGLQRPWWCQSENSIKRSVTSLEKVNNVYNEHAWF